MWHDFRENWRQPGFWSWWWRDVVRSDAKIALVVCLALLLGLGGYVSAKGLSSATEDAAVAEPKPVTTVETVVRRLVHNRDVPVTDVITVVKSARTVVAPGTVLRLTVKQPAPERIVTAPEKIVTEARTQTVAKATTVPVTVVRKTPGATRTVVAAVTQTTPGATQTVINQVAGPTREVTQTREVTRETTLPAQTTTVTAPARTVTETTQVTVAGPPRTVTDTNTVTNQVTVTAPAKTITDTSTVTVTQPVTVTVSK